MTPLLDFEAAAAYLNISTRSVADHIRAGCIRHARIGKHIRIRAEWLDEFIATCERPLTADVVPFRRDRRRSTL
jgi:excisionase family DNA binding protein